MRLLLDTHTFLWWDNGTLPSNITQRIVDSESVFVSAVVGWEISIKSALGKLAVNGSVTDALRDYGFVELPVTLRHTDALRSLPPHHRDPFDRLLIAQAIVENLTILSTDPAFNAYPAKVLWN